MTRKAFRLHPEAAREITEIWEYIAADSPTAASTLREEILDAIRQLVIFPRLGHLRTDIAPDTIRFHLVREYLIAYVPDEVPLLILGVIHGRRNPRTIAAALRARKEVPSQ